jgi:hypothetical protein
MSELFVRFVVLQENETNILPIVRLQAYWNTPRDSTNHSQQEPLTYFHAFCSRKQKTAFLSPQYNN